MDMDYVKIIKENREFKSVNSNTTIGVDCGLKGGISFFNMGILDRFMPMPTINNRKKELDMDEVFKAFSSAKTIFIEGQYSPHGKNQRGMDTNIANFGRLLGIAELVCDDVQVVNATQWKSYYNLNNKTRSPLLGKANKQTAVDRCNQMFETSFTKAQDGMAESVLIGHYGLRKLNASR